MEILSSYCKEQELVWHRVHGAGFKKIEIGLEKPNDPSVKLNIDGALRDNPGLAAIGCVIRDAKGRWLIGGANRLGICNSLEVERWATVWGLNLARDEGYRSVILEMDSEWVFKFLSDTTQE